MSNLQNLQAAFKRYLIEQDDSISSRIISTEKLNSKDRLAIYGNAYRARLVEVLANDYSALNYLLGDDEFQNLSLAYIKTYPSCYYSLRWFGQNLAEFLRSHKYYREYPYLAELADFEWALIDAFDAENTEIFGIDDAAEIPPDSWPNLRIILHPSVRQVICSWNCLALWQSMKNESVPANPQRLDSGVNYLIWRQGLNTTYRSLAPDEAGALSAIGKGCDFAKLCILLARWMDGEKTALRAATLFKTWLAEGLVSQLIY